MNYKQYHTEQQPIKPHFLCSSSWKAQITPHKSLWEGNDAVDSSPWPHT